MSDFSTQSQTQIVCPYCGNKMYDYDHCVASSRLSEQDFECDICNKKFIVTPEYSVLYTTKKIACEKRHSWKKGREYVRKEKYEWDDTKKKWEWMALPENEWEYVITKTC